MGLHAPHGDLQIDTLSDVAYLLHQRPWGSRVLIVGDWNIDQLPSMAVDPFHDRPYRGWHHQAERVLVQSLAARFHLSLSIPDIVYSTPGGPFDHACLGSPIELSLAYLLAGPQITAYPVLSITGCAAPAW